MIQLPANLKSGIKELLSVPELLLGSWTGVSAKECSYCGSSKIRLYPRNYLRLAYEVPEEALKYKDQLRRRDNGRCLECGLDQAFYKFSPEGRRLFYKLGLEVLSTQNEYGTYPPSDEWVRSVSEINYAKRLPKWDEFLRSRGVRKLGQVLQLRFDYGRALRHFSKNYGAETWGMEMTHPCELYARENLPEVRVLEGRLEGLIEAAPPRGVRFDLIICFHTLTHSMNLKQDLLTLRSLLSDEGSVIFCDEVTKKFENPLHLIHFDERTFTKILSEVFGRVDRVDDCGDVSEFIAPYTRRGDNPDLIVSRGNG